MRVSLVVALAENGVIGRDGGLPWRVPADLKHFKAITMGKTIVMGRKTYESIARPLPGRRNVVLSRNAARVAPGVEVVGSLDEALAIGGNEPMIIGGAAIYALALPRASRIYLTEIHGAVDGDTYFPAWERSEWRELSRQFVPRSGEATHDVSFVVLERR